MELTKRQELQARISELRGELARATSDGNQATTEYRQEMTNKIAAAERELAALDAPENAPQEDDQVERCRNCRVACSDDQKRDLREPWVFEGRKQCGREAPFNADANKARLAMRRNEEAQ